MFCLNFSLVYSAFSFTTSYLVSFQFLFIFLKTKRCIFTNFSVYVGQRVRNIHSFCFIVSYCVIWIKNLCNIAKPFNMLMVMILNYVYFLISVFNLDSHCANVIDTHLSSSSAIFMHNNVVLTLGFGLGLQSGCLVGVCIPQ